MLAFSIMTAMASESPGSVEMVAVPRTVDPRAVLVQNTVLKSHDPPF
jgi:hypothetical protein